MKWTYDWLTDYLKTDLSPNEIADKLTRTGLEVDDVFAPISPIASRIVECTPMDGSDHLHILMVDDGSRDQSWSVMKELQEKDENIRLIRLSRNFGSHAAMLAGLVHSTGDCAVIKAADLQEPSEIILEMYESWKQGNNVVLAVRAGREEGLMQRAFARLYYGLVRKMALSNMPPTGFDIFLIDRKVIKVLEAMDEKNSAITLQILWSGFQTDTISYVRQKRETGKSRWTLKKKIKLVVDSIVSFSFIPIRFMTMIGTVFFLISIIWGIYVLAQKLLGNIVTPGYTTLTILVLFSAGLIMFTLGLLGEYIWRTLDASRSRPTYIIEEQSDKNGGKKEK